MTNNASNVIVGANGTVYVAPTGTSAPTDSTTGLNAAFVELGFVAESGVTVIPGQTVTPIMAWQSAYPIRKIITQRTLELDFTLREFNFQTLPLAFGGGYIDEPHPAKFIYYPPNPQDIDPRAMVVDWQDGTIHFRLYVPNGQITTLGQFVLSRTAPAELPIKFELNNDGLSTPWNLFSDDAGLEGS